MSSMRLAVSIAYDLKDDEAIRKLVKAGHGSAEASQQEAIVAAPGSQDARETVGSIGEDFAPKAPVDSSSVMEINSSRDEMAAGAIDRPTVGQTRSPRFNMLGLEPGVDIQQVMKSVSTSLLRRLKAAGQVELWSVRAWRSLLGPNPHRQHDSQRVFTAFAPRLCLSS